MCVFTSFDPVFCVLWANQMLVLSPCLLVLSESPWAATWGGERRREGTVLVWEGQFLPGRAVGAEQWLERGQGERLGEDCLAKEREGPWGPHPGPGRGLLLAQLLRGGM